jgi:dolichol-phosphate mannosyltransferase
MGIIWQLVSRIVKLPQSGERWEAELRSIIVVPTYNEAENIEALLTQVAAALPEAHMLVVDDASPDGTADIAERLCAQYPGYRVLRRTGPRGLGHAYKEGFCRVLDDGYDRIFHMDADLSHDPAYLPAMLRASETADLVIGSRYVRGGGVRHWPWYRILLSRYANLYVRLITGVPTADATAGFRCWTASALQAIRPNTLTCEGYAFAVEMTYRAHQAGLRIAEVPIIFPDRRYGQSKMSGHVIFESILNPWRLRFRRRNFPN